MHEAQSGGRGIVFWGMSFCGTLFPKICLRNAGARLTQLSNVEHGALQLYSSFGLKVNTAIYCLPEDRYLDGRIFISPDGSNRYIRGIGKLLKRNGSIWMAAERGGSHNPVEADLPGMKARFPQGAPVLAKRYGAKLIPAYTTRLGRFNYQITLAPPIEFDDSLPRGQAVQQAAGQFAELLGERIVAQPGTWCWDSSWIRECVATARDGVDDKSRIIDVSGRPAGAGLQ